MELPALVVVFEQLLPSAAISSSCFSLNALCCNWVMFRDGLICGKLTFTTLPP